MEQYMGNVFWNSTTRTYDQDIAEFKTMGINVIRLPLVPQTLTGTDPQGMAPYLKNTESVRIANSRLALETIITLIGARAVWMRVRPMLTPPATTTISNARIPPAPRPTTRPA
jgi:endoglucanase